MNRQKIDHSTLLMTYNHEAYIAQSIESILSQKTDYFFEIIIIDDCSTDRTGEICQDYENRYPGIIRYYKTPYNLGRGRLAVFTVRPLIKGKYWSNLEGDDFWTDDKKLQKQISFLEQNPDYVGCTHGYTVYDTQKETKVNHHADLPDWDITDMVSGKYSLYSHTSTWVWRNTAADINPDGFHLHPELKEPYTFGDNCLYHFMARDGGKIKRLDDVMSCYRFSGQGIWSSLSADDRVRQNKELYERIDRITNFKYSEELKNRSYVPSEKVSHFVHLLKRKSPWLYSFLRNSYYHGMSLKGKIRKIFS